MHQIQKQTHRQEYFGAPNPETDTQTGALWCTKSRNRHTDRSALVHQIQKQTHRQEHFGAPNPETDTQTGALWCTKSRNRYTYFAFFSVKTYVVGTHQKLESMGNVQSLLGLSGHCPVCLDSLDFVQGRPVKFLEKKIVTMRTMTSFSEQGAHAVAREGKQNLGILAHYLLA